MGYMAMPGLAVSELQVRLHTAVYMYGKSNEREGLTKAQKAKSHLSQEMMVHSTVHRCPELWTLSTAVKSRFCNGHLAGTRLCVQKTELIVEVILKKSANY